MRSALALVLVLGSGCIGVIYGPPGPGEEGGSADPGEPGDGDEAPPSRPLDPDRPDEPGGVPVGSISPGRACSCDADCAGTDRNPGLCIHGICGTLGTSNACAPGSAAECPAGMRCWSGTGAGLCYPDYDPATCDGEPDRYGSCVRSPDQGCYQACGRVCDLPGFPPDGGADGEPDPNVEPAPQPPPDPEPDPEPDSGLGPCTGTADECEAARIINEYRAGHVQQGECNHPLRWNERLGRLAHEHQSGPFVRHSSHGYVENVGQAYGLRETTEYIIQYEPGIEPHCAADGSYRMSHHCAAMFCNNETVGVGVYRSGETVYMTMMFGDRDGNPSW